MLTMKANFAATKAAISGTAADIAAAQAAALNLEVASAQSKADAMTADARAAGQNYVTYNLTTLAQSNASAATIAQETSTALQYGTPLSSVQTNLILRNSG